MLYVAIQERRRPCRERLPQLLNSFGTIIVMGAASTDTEFVALCARTHPDVGVLGLNEEEWNPRTLTATLRAKNPSLKLVGIGDANVDVDARVSAEADIPELVHAIESAAVVTQHPRRPSNAVEHETTSYDAPLTARQSEVLRLVSDGLSAAQISQALQVSPKTVEHHKREIFTRLAVHSQAQAVAVAFRCGLLTAAGGTP